MTSVLMCRPEHFTVSYRINPWMRPEQATDTRLALAQWETLHAVYRDLGFDVRLVDPLPGYPDMVYAANGGTVIDGTALTARFRHTERAAEGPAYGAWFRAAGFAVHEARRVDRSEPTAHLRGDLAELVGLVAAVGLLAPDVGVERLPGDVLHDQDRPPRAGREIVDAAHVRVADAAGQERLLAQGFVVPGEAGLVPNDLQRDRLLDRSVERQEHLTHASLTETLTDLVAVVDDRAFTDRAWRRLRQGVLLG